MYIFLVVVIAFRFHYNFPLSWIFAIDFLKKPQVLFLLRLSSLPKFFLVLLFYFLAFPFFRDRESSQLWALKCCHQRKTLAAQYLAFSIKCLMLSDVMMLIAYHSVCIFTCMYVCMYAGLLCGWLQKQIFSRLCYLPVRVCGPLLLLLGKFSISRHWVAYLEEIPSEECVYTYYYLYYLSLESQLWGCMWARYGANVSQCRA